MSQDRVLVGLLNGNSDQRTFTLQSCLMALRQFDKEITLENMNKLLVESGDSELTEEEARKLGLG